MSHTNGKKKQEKTRFLVLVGIFVVLVAAALFFIMKDPEKRGWASGFGIENRQSLKDTTWTWRHTKLPSGSMIQGPGGEAFVLTFQSDGRLTSTTDCNSVFGEFALIGNQLSIGTLASTLMYCGAATLESEYGAELMRAESFVIEGNTLRIQLRDNSGEMLFMRK